MKRGRWRATCSSLRKDSVANVPQAVALDRALLEERCGPDRAGENLSAACRPRHCPWSIAAAACNHRASCSRSVRNDRATAAPGSNRRPTSKHSTRQLREPPRNIIHDGTQFRGMNFALHIGGKSPSPMTPASKPGTHPAASLDNHAKAIVEITRNAVSEGLVPGADLVDVWADIFRLENRFEASVDHIMLAVVGPRSLWPSRSSRCRHPRTPSAATARRGRARSRPGRAAAMRRRPQAARISGRSCG